MPEYIGPIKKLSAEFTEPIEYVLPIGEETVPLNALIGKALTLNYLNKISCIQCFRKTTKSFQQGYCYPCYNKLLDCNLCMLYPEKCNYPKMECPDSWEHAHCKQPHIVYLANSSGLKVGITRTSQIPTRWIDQGASQAITLFKVSNRYQSGVIEVLFKQFVADKTNWRKMLSKDLQIYNMISVKEELLEKAKQALTELEHGHQNIELVKDEGLTITYPVLEYPQKLHSLSLDKEPIINSTLLGIKGQYLVLDKGVLNIRKHSGYHISLYY